MVKDLEEKVDEEGNSGYYTELGEKVEWITEQNYLFNFSQDIKDAIENWASTEPSPIKPDQIKNLTIRELHDSKDHLSISRPNKRISWGIPVPDDSSQTVYVWLDALSNYKTVMDSFDDFEGEMIHIIGKDINKFHSIYWPAFLSACEYPLPKEVIVHGHWKKDNFKMSKRLGNIVDPFEIIEKYGQSAVRTYLL